MITFDLFTQFDTFFSILANKSYKQLQYYHEIYLKH